MSRNIPVGHASNDGHVDHFNHVANVVDNYNGNPCKTFLQTTQQNSFLDETRLTAFESKPNDLFAVVVVVTVSKLSV